MKASGKRYIVYGNKDAEFRIWNMADLHLGNDGVATDRLAEDIEAIRADPCSFWFGGGDYADYIGIGDKRFDPEALAAFLGTRDLGHLGVTLRDRAAKVLEPVADKCLGIAQGNHDRMYELRQDQQGLTEDLAKKLGAPYLGYCMFCDLVFVWQPRARRKPYIAAPGDIPTGRDRWERRVFLHHGAGYAQTEGGKINRLVSFMRFFDADITFVAHLHDQHIKALVRLRADAACNRLIADPQIGIMTGSYLRTYAEGTTTYGEIKGYAPTPLGAVCAYIRPSLRQLGGRIDIAPERIGDDKEDKA